MLNYFKRVSAIILLIVLSGFSEAQDVYWEPNNPVQGGQVTIFYDLEARGILPNTTNPCYIHLGFDDWNNTNDFAMTKNGNGLWQYEVTIPNNATVIDFVFTDLQGNWDNNGGVGVDWHIDVYSEGLSVVIVSPDVQNRYNDIFRSPIILAQNEVLPIAVTTISTSAPTDSIFLMINDDEVSKTNNDTLKYDFDTSLYSANEYTLLAIGQDVTEYRDSVEFAIVVRPNQNSMLPPNSVKPGLNFNGSNATLALFAPYKEYVYLIGDINDWKVDNNYLMNKYEANADSILWWIELSNLVPGTEYAFQYLVDGEIRIADPYTEIVLDPWNDQYIPSETYPYLKEYPHGKTSEPVSVVETGQMEYDWQHNDNFERPEQKDLVIYELLIRDFIDTHNYQTLIDTLDYLDDLGVNAIELMPINEFEGNSSWGYNPSFYFAPDKYYGPREDLKAFIDECHKRDIAVIQDIVLNHSYSQSPLVRLYWDSINNRPAANNPWYNVQSPNSVYSWGYDFNHESMHTNAFVDRVLRYWIEEYKIDGFRLDFTKGLTNKGGDGSGYDVSRIAILKRFADEVWSYAPDTYMILEHFADNVEEKELSDCGFMLWGNANHNYNEATMGYNANSDFSWGFYKKRGWTEPNLVTYMESHDEERLMYKNLQFGNSSGTYNTKNLTTAIERQKIAAAFFLTLPGPKMIWQFGELGYDYSIDYNGRVGEKPIRWDYFNNSDRKVLYNVYSQLINLRKENEIFTSPNTNVDLWLNDSKGLKRIKLSHASMQCVIVGNFGVDKQTIKPEFPYAGEWYDYFSGLVFTNSDNNFEISLEPGQFRIFTNKKLTINLGVDDLEDSKIPLTFSLSQNYPNPFNPSTTINYSIPSLVIQREAKNLVTLKVYDILGNEIVTLVNEVKSPGEYSVQFDGSSFSNGIYFYALSYVDKVLTKKMLLLK